MTMSRPVRRLLIGVAILLAPGAALAQNGAPPPDALAQTDPAAVSKTVLPAPISGASEAGQSPGEADASEELRSDAAYGAFQRGYYLSALRIAEPLANLGDPAAQTLLGEIHMRGLGVPRDEIEAARWYEAAAKSGVAEAQFRFALLLIEGRAVAPDDRRAQELMKAAADAGNPLAAFNYGQMLIQSSPSGGFSAALGYFERAAASGIPDAQYALSQLYAYGRGVAASDPAAARRWLQAAALKGHDTAQIELGIWLINGRGGPAEPQAGFRWLKGAAENGNPIAINRVAHLFKDGIGVAADLAAAAKWTVLARRAANTDPELDAFFRSLGEAEQRAALEAANRFRSG